MKSKYIISLLLVLPVLGACNQTDDVIKIFTGKTWKLNFVNDSKGDCTKGYFLAEAQWERSMKLLSEKGNFVITFTGAEIDGEVIGAYGGRAAGTPISGKWKANGENNAFRISGQAAPGNNEDVLGRVFINALINAYKYEGDTAGNLRIYFKEGNVDKYLLLYANN
ncbi:MAG: DUF4847 domain-containing protein [Mediterranea sp.]|jgi:hypothetical protein|nr:DUF4847 domain-containing protein [Mediterranea sp.]